jgi:hypothetical protein
VSTVFIAPFTVTCPVWMRVLTGAGVAVGCGVGLGVGVGMLVGVAVGVGVVVPVVPPHPATITAMKMMMATGKWYLRNLICLLLFYIIGRCYIRQHRERESPTGLSQQEVVRYMVTSHS